MNAPTIPAVALSVRQPWAWAIIHGGKDVENRSARAASHGLDPRRIAIHAAKGMSRDEYELASEFMAALDVACPRPNDLVRGAIIGVVTVDAVVKKSTSPWFSGPRGLVLSDPVAVEPIPAVGALGYFEWQRKGEIQLPLRWMVAWPGSGRTTHQPGVMPLFGTN